MGARVMHGITEDDEATRLPSSEIDAHVIAGKALLELRSATAQFPPFNSAHEGYAILLEEVDELWDAIRANDIAHAHREALQVAAMAIRLIRDIPAVR